MTEVFAVNSPGWAVLDVVFVHGLDGDTRRTWSREELESFWPRWPADDVEDVAVSTVGYDAWSSGWRDRSMNLPDRPVNIPPNRGTTGLVTALYRHPQHGWSAGQGDASPRGGRPHGFRNVPELLRSCSGHHVVRSCLRRTRTVARTR